MSAQDLQSFIYERIREGRLTLVQAFAVLAEFDAICTDMTRVGRAAIKSRIETLS
jgi:hypothetical protein